MKRMTVEQLMQPRYKVVADYPHSPFKIGQILFKVRPLYGLGYIATFDGQQNIDNSWVTQYPHIFKKLEWWEERNIEDMPEYVSVSSGKVYKVNSYRKDLLAFYFTDKCDTVFLNGTIPATEEEYNQFITLKTL